MKPDSYTLNNVASTHSSLQLPLPGNEESVAEELVFSTLAQSLLHTKDAVKIVEHRNGEYYFRYFNHAAEALFQRLGFESKTWLHKTPQECLPPQIALEMVNGYSKVASTHQEQESEVHFGSGSSGLFIFHRRLIPMYSDKGEIRLMLSLMSDATQDWLFNKAQQQYSLLLEYLTEILILADTSGVYYINHTARTLLEIPGDYTQPLYLRALFADNNIWDNTIEPELLVHDIFSGEVLLRTFTGKIFPASLTINLQRNEQGNIDNYIFIANNLAEQKKMSERLNYLERTSSFVMNNVSLYAFIELDTKGKISSWNQSATAMFRYASVDVIGRPLALLEPTIIQLQHLSTNAQGHLHYDEKLLGENILQLALKTENIVFEAPRITALGSILITKNILTPIYNGKAEHQGFSLMIQDISEVRHLEFALRRKKREADIFVEQSPDLVLRFSLQKTCEYINTIAESLLSVPRTTIIGKHIDEIAAMFPALEDMGTLAERALQTGKELHRLSTTTRHSTYQFSIRILPEFDELHRLESLLVIASNVATEIVAAETILKTYSETKLWQEFKERFRKTLSHELRTPLAGIKMSADILNRYTDSLSKEDIVAHAQDINEAVKETNTMIDELLLRMKQESHTLTAVMEKTDIIAFCVHEIDIISKQHQYPIEFSTSLSKLYIPLDKYLFQIALKSILENAIMYSDDKRIPVRIWLGIMNNQVCLSVHNVGFGIAQENITNIFQPFFRGKNVEHITGLGMGLYIAKHCLTLLQSSIEVQSEQGNETTISVFLPTQ